MSYLSNVYSVMSEYSNHRGNLAKWADGNPQKFQIVTKIERLRREMDE